MGLNSAIVASFLTRACDVDSIELEWKGGSSHSLHESENRSMSEFEEWAGATYRQSNIEVDPSDLALIELIYAGTIHQLEALDHIDLEKFPAVGIDLRHAPKPS